ncbi:MAG: 2-hydroxyacyl-CoA dehydratase family protein [Deltaproteobacteria bacterium]|jgi:benzoyl-CoA reductase/2-hydroxyglutaryl-CoA dehydratase subunit BcrC/BadD/HgdB|nr:2-hydroxyacyl-CoA dehydratase family protein [Deltaproteobacteria bacterium]
MPKVEFKLPETFESFGEARKSGFLKMKALKEKGAGVVGVFCVYTPLEVFLAAGLVPVSLCSTSDETIPEAEKTLPRNLCPLIKASYGFAVADKCPYMYFSDLVVGETTCDGKKKMYELLGQIKDVHVLNLPQTQSGQRSLPFLISELKALKDKVETAFGVTIAEADLTRAIKEKNAEKRLIKEFYELSQMDPPPMTGLQQLQVLFGSQFKFDLPEKLADLRQTIDDLKEARAKGERPVAKGAKRLVMTGCPTGGATEKVIKAIEESGAVIVAYENCTGARQYDREVREDGDPWEALAEYYLGVGCSVMTPNPNRLELLGRLCREFKADGVVEMVLQACHTYAIETQTIRSFLSDKGLPFLTLETDYSAGDVGQLKTRAAAFIETLG